MYSNCGRPKLILVGHMSNVEISQEMPDSQLLFIALHVYVSYVCNTHYVIVVTHAQVHCLICTHDARGHTTPKGMQHLRASVAISGPVLQLICNSSSTLTVKTCPNILPLTALPVYITTESL